MEPIYLQLTGRADIVFGEEGKWRGTARSYHSGDVQLRVKFKAVRNAYGHLQLVVFDGSKWRHLYRFGFAGLDMVDSPKQGYTMAGLNALAASFMSHAGQKLKYERGYTKVMNSCKRCGMCCITPSALIVDPAVIADIPQGELPTGDHVLFKPGNIACPHLSWTDDGKACCGVHHYSWYSTTPCAKHCAVTRPTPCKQWKDAELKKEKSDTWYLAYYPNGSQESLKHNYQEIFREVGTDYLIYKAVNKCSARW